MADNGLALFMCDHCGSMYKNRPALIVHVGKHEETQPFTCDLRFQDFKLKFILLCHIRGRHQQNTRRYKCNQCGSNYKDEKALKRHQTNIHKNLGEETDLFDCDLCSKHFSWKGRLMAHIRTRHKTVHVFKCQLCPHRHYTHKRYLERHQAQIHQGVKFVCDHCGRSRRDRYGFGKHVALHQKQQPHTASVHPVRKKKLQCDDCGKQFTNRHHLAIHTLPVHLKLRPFKCELCQAEFFLSDDLAKHKETAVHTNKAFMFCDLCARPFRGRTKLAVHCFALHMQLCVFKCSVCFESFKRSD